MKIFLTSLRMAGSSDKEQQHAGDDKQTADTDGCQRQHRASLLDLLPSVCQHKRKCRVYRLIIKTKLMKLYSLIKTLIMTKNTGFAESFSIFSSLFFRGWNIECIRELDWGSVTSSTEFFLFPIQTTLAFFCDTNAAMLEQDDIGEHNWSKYVLSFVSVATTTLTNPDWAF